MDVFNLGAMFFKYVKPLIRTRPTELHRFKEFQKRCQHARFFGTANIKNSYQSLENPVQILPQRLRCFYANGKRPLFASCVPVSSQHRTVTSAASTGPGNSDYGVLAKVADSAPVHLAENVLTSIQEITGLPWWANIMCTSAVLRTAVTLPLSIYQMHIIDRLEKLRPEIKKLEKELHYEVVVYGKTHGWTSKVAKMHFRRNMKRLIGELYIRNNCHPFKAFLVMWIQIPMWILISLALRNFSFNTFGSHTDELVHKQLQNGGALWFPDLTVPDSTWILPLILGFLNLLQLEIFALRAMGQSRFQKYLNYIFRGISIIIIPISAILPSCMPLYWASSSFVGLAHTLFQLSPTVRRLLRIPRTKLDSETPYKDLLAAFVAKYIQKK